MHSLKILSLLFVFHLSSSAWKVCYTDSDKVLMASETSSAITEPDADGYRADCTGVTFNQVRYVNLETNEVACFTRNSGSVTLGSNWKFNDAEAWTSNTAGVASTDYSYQLNVCSNGWMETGLMISGIFPGGCRKHCNSWCGDSTSPYFRINGDTGASYNGVAFNENGHRSVDNKLMQVSVRQGSDIDCTSDETCDDTLTTSTAAFWPTKPKTPSDLGVILHTHTAQYTAFRVPVGLYTVLPENWHVVDGYVTWYCNSYCTDQGSPGGCTPRDGGIMTWVDDVDEVESYRQCLMDSVEKQGGKWAPLEDCQATDAADSTDAPAFIQTGALCGVFSCGDDAMLKPLMNTEVGNSFEECCACSYASLNHAFLGSFMKGEFDNQSRKLKLSFDLPSDVHIQSVEWNGASDDSLSYAKGLWTSENVNECRATYILDEGLAQIFGSGSLFTLSGTTLATSIRVVATSQITEEGTTFDRTYSEDVPILVGLETQTTVQATFHMTMEEGQYVHITGNAEHFATDGTVKLTMMVTTPGCIQTSASIVSGTEHLTNPEFTFGDPSLMNNLCAQEVVLTFDPVEEFADTISIQFTSRQNVPFTVDVDVNIQAGSILDYLPFDAVMTFHAESTFSDDPQSEFLLGAEVYAKIELSPLVNLPLSSITINSFTLTQTGYSGELETTDLMNEGWAGFSYTATPEENEIAAEFELESTHFHVTEEGELCEVETDISIVYQDGTTVRRLLSMRRRLTTQQISNGFAILESESESMVATMQRRIPSANAFLILVLIVAAFLAFRACVATKRDEYSSLLTEYAEF